MLQGILQGVFLGFVITAIPGAVVLEATHRALAHKAVMSFLYGTFIGVGLVIAVTILGLSSLLRNATWSHVFYFLSGATLLFIGLTSLASKKYARRKPSKQRSGFKISPHHGALVAGIILATANPIGILFWITMIGRYFNEHDSYLRIIANCIAITLGAAIFYGFLLVVIDMTHKKLPQKYLTTLTDVFGVVILVYGGFIMSKVL